MRSYWVDARENRIDILSAQLELIGQRSIGSIRVEEIEPLVLKELTNTELHNGVIARLKRIQTEFDVDNAILMRLNDDGKFSIIADGNAQFYINEPVFIHDRFPETLLAATEAWTTCWSFSLYFWSLWLPWCVPTGWTPGKTASTY